MTTTRTATRHLNPTALSYIISDIQAQRKAGKKTGIASIKSRRTVINGRPTNEVKITATEAGHALIASLVRQVMDMAPILGADRVDV